MRTLKSLVNDDFFVAARLRKAVPHWTTKPCTRTALMNYKSTISDRSLDPVKDTLYQEGARKRNESQKSDDVREDLGVIKRIPLAKMTAPPRVNGLALPQSEPLCRASIVLSPSRRAK